MTPADMAALWRLRPGDCVTSHDARDIRALLSALEEAQNFGRAQDEKAHRFLEERNGAREALAAAEARADALQAEVDRLTVLVEKQLEALNAKDDDGSVVLREANGRIFTAESALEEARARTEEMEKSKWYERDRRKEAESRADALQAEVERLTKERDGHEEMGHEAVRRADAAWRALENVSVYVASRRALRESEHATPLLRFCAEGGIGQSPLRALQPPSATPNEET